jgi:hypothetical protein
MPCDDRPAPPCLSLGFTSEIPLTYLGVRYGAGMGTQVWYRNPKNYIRECAEVGVENFVWDHGFIKKKGIDVNAFMTLYYGYQKPWRAMVVSSLGAPLLDRDHFFGDNPAAVFPVWKYGDPFSDLEELVANPVGLNEKKCGVWSGQVEGFQPIYGQPHIVVCTYMPNGKESQAKKFYRVLADLQEDYPDCMIHVHGLYTYNILFGLGYTSVDIEARTDAAKSRIRLPNGLIVRTDEEFELKDNKHWVELMGFKIKEMETPRNRCLYNIKTALWAADNFRENLKFQHKGFIHLDPDDPTEKKDSRPRSVFVRRVVPLPDDKYFCNVCSLKNSCKFFRVGAVCSVPNSKPAPLAHFFKTRDSEQILEGMNHLLQIEAERITAARQDETANDRLNPETTKMLDKMFNHVERFAKLVDPNLRNPGNQTTNQTLILNGNTPQELASQVMRMLVAQGIPASEITPEMVMEIIEAPGDDINQKAIDASAVIRAEP